MSLKHMLLLLNTFIISIQGTYAEHENLQLNIQDNSANDSEVSISIDNTVNPNLVNKETTKANTSTEPNTKSETSREKMTKRPFPKCINNQIHYASGYVGGVCYNNAAVSTEVPVCSEVGVEILKAGGNAVDAAVAACICVGVINSFSSGIGGGGFALLKMQNDKGEDIVEMIDFRETAPSAIKVKDFEGKKDLTKKGGLAIGVPGEVAGLHFMHQKRGKLKWEQLFEPSIKIARKFEVSEQLYKRLFKLKDCIFKDPGLKEIYTVNGELVKVGSFISRNNYADTLERISKNPNDFYDGETTKNMVESIKNNGGVITTDDFKTYTALQREVLCGTFLDYKVYSTNLPTSGCLLMEALNIIEKYDLCDIKEKGENLETKLFPHYHLLVEIFKFMSAKRGSLADVDKLSAEKRDKMRELVKKLISKEYATEIVKKIDLNRVLEDKEYGFSGIPHDDHGTTHLNVVDEDNNAVLITSTVNLEFGAKIMCRKTGVIFNNEIDDFYVPGVKNAFDLAGMKSNLIKPNSRPFSSASPLLLIKNTEMIALGAAGGTRIPTSLISVIFHMMLGKSLAEAIKELRMHNQFYPKKTYVEGDFPMELRNYLVSMGHVVEESSMNSIFTSVQGIRVIKDESGEKTIEAVSDERKGGAAYGY